MKGENGVAGGSSINKPVQNQVSSSTIEISKAGGTTAITNTGASILSVDSTGTYYVYILLTGSYCLSTMALVSA